MNDTTKVWAPGFLFDAKVGDEIAVHRQRIDWVDNKASFVNYQIVGTVLDKQLVSAGSSQGVLIKMQTESGDIYQNLHMPYCHIDLVLTRWDEFAEEHKDLHNGCGVDHRLPEDRAVYRIWCEATCTVAYHEMADHYMEAMTSGGYVTAQMREAYIHETRTAGRA